MECSQAVAQAGKRRRTDVGEVGCVVEFRPSAILVKWDTDSQDVLAPLARLKPWVAPESASKKQKRSHKTGKNDKGNIDEEKEVQESAQIEVKESLTWVPVHASFATSFLAHHLLAALFHLHAATGSGPDVVGVMDRCDNRLFALRPCESRQLCLVPYSADVRLERPDECGDETDYVTAQVKVGNSAEVTFYIAAPTLTPEQINDCVFIPFWLAR